MKKTFTRAANEAGHTRQGIFLIEPGLTAPPQGDPRPERTVEDMITEDAGVKIRHLPVGTGEERVKIAIFAPV